MAPEVRRREALRPGDLGYAHTDKSIFLPKLPPAEVFEIFLKSKQNFRKLNRTSLIAQIGSDTTEKKPSKVSRFFPTEAI